MNIREFIVLICKIKNGKRRRRREKKRERGRGKERKRSIRTYLLRRVYTQIFSIQAITSPQSYKCEFIEDNLDRKDE